MDYKSYFGLTEMPFNISPNPRFLFKTPQHTEALNKCQYVVEERGGLAVVYGNIGMGKTTIARHLHDIFEESGKYTVASLVTPALRTQMSFLQAIMHEFDVQPKRSYYTSLVAFNEFMLKTHKDGKGCVVIVDEAQKFTPSLMDVVHTLLNYESNTEKFLQIILIGQLELSALIDAIPPIKSRVAIFSELEPLNLDDTRDMIAFRWHTASGGKRSDPFTEDALQRIFEYSKGLPREINKLCHESLMVACAQGEQQVTDKMVDDAALEVHLNLVT